METDLPPAVNTPPQIPPTSGARNKKFLFMLFAFMIFLSLAISGFFIIKNTYTLKQDNISQASSPKECSYKGKVYKLGESVPSSDRCNSCSCSEGGLVSCTAMACEGSNSSDTLGPSDAINDTSSSPGAAMQPSTYIDEEFGYQVTYDSSRWMFRRTYGKGAISNTESSGTPGIISGFDLHRPSNINARAVIVLNVLNANSETDIDEWIRKYELNVPKNASSQLIIKPNLRAREYSYKYDADDSFVRRSRYFIYNNNVFRIFYSELNEFSQETNQIIESFRP